MNTPDQSDSSESNNAARIAERYAAITHRAHAACARVGRDPASVTVIGVTKTKPAAVVRAAAQAGITEIGENYVQELAAKHAELGSLVNWHMIGHLQRNKARLVVPFVRMIHSVDSERLAIEIDNQARIHNRVVGVLVQVNTSGEPSKFGTAPADAPALARAVSALGNVRLEGLMTIAAFLDDAEALRPMFRGLRELRNRIEHDLGMQLPHLSMGMTGDFEVAIEEGATLVRVGTALFGDRA